MEWHISSFKELDTADLYQILSLRINVFMLEQNCLYPECDHKDQAAAHLFLQHGDRILAYARLLPPGISFPNSAAIGRVVVDSEYRSSGLGRDLVSRALTQTLQLYPGTPIRISAQQHLEEFYASLGFHTESPAYLEDGIPHIRMVYTSSGP